jgi:methenyltetrahydromethanopterin cyclohydrolase
LTKHQFKENFSVNENSLAIVKEMMARSRELGLMVGKLANGTTLIDAGVEAPGGLRAGLMVAKAALGGLAEVEVAPIPYADDLVLPTVKVSTDFPVISLLVCQQPLPTIEVGEYSAITSGPGKALMRKPEEFFEISGYSEIARFAVFVMQSDDLPDEKVSSYIAKECRITPSDLFLIVAPTNSMAGAVQVSARVLEDPFRRLSFLGFDVNKVKCAVGSAPMTPVYPDIWKKQGIAPDDMLLYGSRVIFFAKPDEEDDLSSLVKELVTENSPFFGKSFFEILAEAGGRFKDIDFRKYTCAQATIYDLSNGKIYSAGKIHLDMIRKLSS